jgi:hypothetical protein
MIFSFNTCHFVLFSFLSLSANAETVRGVHRELVDCSSGVNLNTAGTFAILAKTGISTVPTSVITGNIGVSPIAATAMTGFSMKPGSDPTHTLSDQVIGNGKCFASDYLSPTPTMMTAAVSDMEGAYTAAAACDAGVGGNLNLGGGLIGGETLNPGVYTFDRDIVISGDVTFDAGGDDTKVFIVQTTGNVIVGSGMRVHLAGQAKASNIVWQVAGFVDMGTTAHMEGVLLVKTGVVFKTLSSLNGRILSQTAVTLDSATITQPPTV